MKKKFLLVTILLLSLSKENLIFAQTSFGIRGGMNLSKIRISEFLSAPEPSQSIPGFNIGVFAETPIKNNLSIQPELFFSSMGSALDNGEDKYFLNYISIPVLFKYKINNISIGAGPQLGILLSAKNRWTADGNILVDVKDVFNATDFSSVFNLDYTVNNKIILGTRYQLGLSNILNMRSGDIDPGTTAKNNAFQIIFGYKF